MNIKEFKKGDLVTRNEIVKRGYEDGSYCGDKLIFKGHDSESKMIFMKRIDSCIGIGNSDIISLSYAREGWDEGWCFFPEQLYQKSLEK